MFPFAFGRSMAPVYREFPGIRRGEIPVSPGRSFHFVPEIHPSNIGGRGMATLEFNPDIPHSCDPNKVFICDKCRKVRVSLNLTREEAELTVLAEYTRIARRSWQALDLS